LSKKRSIIQTFFLTTTYTSRNVFMKSGINADIIKFFVSALILIFANPSGTLDRLINCNAFQGN